MLTIKWSPIIVLVWCCYLANFNVGISTIEFIHSIRHSSRSRIPCNLYHKALNDKSQLLLMTKSKLKSFQVINKILKVIQSPRSTKILKVKLYRGDLKDSLTITTITLQKSSKWLLPAIVSVILSSSVNIIGNC